MLDRKHHLPASPAFSPLSADLYSHSFFDSSLYTILQYATSHLRWLVSCVDFWLSCHGGPLSHHEHWSGHDCDIRCMLSKTPIRDQKPITDYPSKEYIKQFKQPESVDSALEKRWTSTTCLIVYSIFLRDMDTSLIELMNYYLHGQPASIQ